MSLTTASPVEIARQARLSSRTLATLPVAQRNAALAAIHEALLSAKDEILAANAKDVEAAKLATADGSLNPSILKRLDLSRPGKFEDMLAGVKDVEGLDDPVGRVDLKTELDDGLILQRQTCPIGVLLIIFEARPEVIANIASLAIKSGNAAILKGGKESTASFQTISTVISRALASTAVPNAAVQLVATRDAVDALLELSEYIDLVIPRGSNDLVRHCQRKAHMPVLGHADGLCSIYIHSDADAQMAAAVVVDSKTDYPAACNAVETLLVHESVLHTVLPAVATALFAKGVTLKCDAPAKAALTATLPGSAHLLLQDSVESDYDTEFLDIVLAVRTVPSSPATPPDQTSPSTSLSFAIAHINTHGSHHTECILTASKAVSEEFFAGVDAACKFWNCSTRFCDGMRFGFGTEVGISTNKVHARGPVGLEGLTIHEYRLSGQGQVAASYSGAGARAYTHRKLDL